MKKTPKRRAFYILWVLAAIYMIDFADRKVLSVLFEAIKHDWQITDVQLSFLEGITSLVVALMVLPMSIIIDRWSRKYMIALMVALWSIITFMCAFAENYNQLLFLRAAIGIGEAAYAPAAVSLIAKVFPWQHRARYIGIFDAAAPLGVALGMIVGGYVGMIYGWRYAFGLVAIPGIILSVMALFIRDYHTLPVYVNNKKSSFSLSFVAELRHISPLWFVYFAFACLVGINTSVLDWAPSFFIRVHQLSSLQAGAMSATIALTALIGAPLGGYVADKLRQTRPDANYIVCMASALGVGIFLFAALQSSHIVAVYVFFTLYGLFAVSFLGPATAIIQSLVQPGVRTIAYAINVVIINVCGSFIIIMLVGYMSELWGISLALSIICSFALVAVILFFIAKTKAK